MNDHDDLVRLRVDEQIRHALEKIEAGMEAARNEFASIRPQLDHIEQQVVKTNGRVTHLEMWREKSTGVVAAIAALGSLAGWLISQGISFFKN